ncbi:MAG: MAPEG family protein [Betaproteobacteria bacterium]
MIALPFTSLITLLLLLLMFVTGVNVARARGRYGVKAPAVSGHEMFERAFRVQMNTLENAVLMLPALWLYAGLIGDKGAAIMGLAWLLARVWYAMAYQADPAKRGGAYAASFLAFALLWLGALWGAVRLLLH